MTRVSAYRIVNFTNFRNSKTENITYSFSSNWLCTFNWWYYWNSIEGNDDFRMETLKAWDSSFQVKLFCFNLLFLLQKEGFATICRWRGWTLRAKVTKVRFYGECILSLLTFVLRFSFVTIGFFFSLYSRWNFPDLSKR